MAAEMVVSTSDLRIAELMTIDPITVSMDATIEEAEELMRRNRVTGLPVVRHRERGVRVGEVMSAPALTIDAGASVRDAAIRMHVERVHRLVAIDEHGRPIGVISAMDLVALVAEG